ncbi:MAG TPA: phosphinothricin acetyltransferase [Lentisphaeria bacterium]|nr:MAG: phosphinothricin acetyltransferase [Lentisphaerae bacterium GWF2_38_69]HBM15870.1 phosphinothricin acetyltransferase [Lentisphaeria bacterium]
MIRECFIEDAAEICRIYNYYVENTTITFEEEPLAPSEIEKRISNIQSKGHPWLVYEENLQIIGYAYASEFKSRCAYKYTLETSFYLSHEHLSKGIGTKLYTKLIDECRKIGMHSLVGVIAVPNIPSASICKKFGFQKAGIIKEAGFKFNKWIDIEYWQLIL